MLKKKQTLWMLGAACLIVLFIAGFSTIGFSGGDGGLKSPLFPMQSDEQETAPSDGNTEPDSSSSKETAEGHDDSGRTHGQEPIGTVVIELPTETETTTEAETTIEPETTTEPEPVGPSIYDGYLFADVKLYLNVRKEPNIKSDIVGKLYVGDKATILEQGEEWTYITSGNVKGYVSNEYTVTSHAAEKYVIEEGLYVAKTTVSGLRIRAEANTECEYYGSAYKGQTFSAISEEDGWVKIKHSTASNPSGVAYLSAEYVELSYNFGEGITIEEEQEQIRLAKEAAEKAAREAFIKKILANSQVINTANRAAFTFSDEDIYLLACLVYEEAGGEPYEGKLAVANVVLNRYLAGYGDTLTEIIYAKNQFSTAKSGVLDKRLEKGPSDSCVRAAKEAVAGVNNIGDYCHFITTEKANYSLYYQYTILHNHCFYKRVWN